MQPVKTVACPTCGKRTPYSPENPHRPFCSERCKLIDLGQWATESYRIPVVEEEVSGRVGTSFVPTRDNLR